MQKSTLNFLFAVFVYAISNLAVAETSILSLQQQWAVVNYTLAGDAQEKAFKALIKEADTFSNQNPKNADRLIWRAIIKSSFAGAKGGLGALSFAKAAKKDLEESLAIDETALSGSASTSLATLYFRVPGWPIGFGSNKKAAKYFEKALQLNPQGIDPNFFYGQFLYQEKNNYAESKKYLLKAKNAVPRETRPLADTERQKEITTLLAKVKKKLKGK